MNEASRWLVIVSLLSACAGADASDLATWDESALESDSEDGDENGDEHEPSLGSISQALCTEEPCNDVVIIAVRPVPEDGREQTGEFTGGSLCRAYKDPDFRGKSITLEPGRVFNSLGGGMNDTISSFRLPPNCELAIWPHPDQRGEEVRFFSDVSFVGPRYNDAISSFACACRLDLGF
jgi:hypothetical protein